MIEKKMQKWVRFFPATRPKWDRHLKAIFTTEASFKHFVLHFVHFLGVSWEPYWASWGSLGRPLDPKTIKNPRFFKVFEKALWSSWWPSWAHLLFFLKFWQKLPVQVGSQKLTVLKLILKTSHFAKKHQKKKYQAILQRLVSGGRCQCTNWMWMMWFRGAGVRRDCWVAPVCICA